MLATETGDGFLLTFATPSDAIAAAVAAQRRLAVEPSPENSDVRVRMAMHADEVATTPAGLVGLAIHHTARIASSAHGGQILMSEAARALSPHEPDGAELRDLGQHLFATLVGSGCIRLSTRTFPTRSRACVLLVARRTNLPAPSPA